VEGLAWPDQTAEAGDCFIRFPVLDVDSTRRRERAGDARLTEPMALMPFVLEGPIGHGLISITGRQGQRRSFSVSLALVSFSFVPLVVFSLPVRRPQAPCDDTLCQTKENHAQVKSGSLMNVSTSMIAAARPTAPFFLLPPPFFLPQNKHQTPSKVRGGNGRQDGTPVSSND
jgi:hypothetical protein